MQIKIDNKICIDHIIWQSIFKCIMDGVACKNCYVSESPTSLSDDIETDLIDHIFIHRDIECKQLTISLDTLKTYPLDLVHKLKWLIEFYNESEDCGCPNATRKKRGNWYLPELCFAAYNWQTLSGWDKKTREYPMNILVPMGENILMPCTLLSLSNFPAREDFCSGILNSCIKSRTVLNYNKMADWNTVDQPSFKLGVQYTDQIHLVLRKNPLGDEQDPSALKYWYQARKYIIDQGYRDKLVEDACLQDSVKLLKTGFKCGAGISKIHVWPGNTVSGCPYDSHHLVNGSSPSKKDLMTEIRAATERCSCHSMDHCKIPNLLTHVSALKTKFSNKNLETS